MIKERTGIEIQEEVTPWGQYYQKVMTQLVGGQGADLVTEDTFWYGDFFKSGALLPLDDLIKDDKSFDLADFDTVAEVMKPNRRRRLTDAQRQSAKDRLARFAFQPARQNAAGALGRVPTTPGDSQAVPTHLSDS